MHYLDPVIIIKTLGLVGILAIIFAESGLFFGFFFPGDSLLFTAGLFAHAGILPFVPLLIGCIIAAVAGDSVGYFTGASFGPKLFTKEDSLFFKKRYLLDAERFYEKYGAKTIVLARFIPFIRTFAPIVAGIGKMRYATFVFYNIVGGILWSILMLSTGFYVGVVIPAAERYLFLITAAIILISVVPIVLRVIKARR